MSKIKKQFNSPKPAFFRFKKINKDYLITNDVGDFSFLNNQQFNNFVENKLNKGKAYQELSEKGFIKDNFDWSRAIMRYQKAHTSLFQGTSLHIMVMTLRCDSRCVYCQTSSRPMNGKGFDMDKDTAKKIVDLIFENPSPAINIEFQGGEPLANWPVVKFVVQYARKKETEIKKSLMLTLVSNLHLMTDDKLNFLIDNRVGLCTSLDGPEFLHNLNRPFIGGNSYQDTIKWVEKIKSIEKDRIEQGSPIYQLNALLTISKKSLNYHKEIIDEYLKHKFIGLHLRPLNYLGFAQQTQNEIGYSTLEFLDFWRKSMDYIIDINLSGQKFLERGTVMLLRKILKGEDPGYVDLQSPCGAAIGQMLYNYDGKIYTCDEGRMLENDTFLLEDIKNYKPSTQSKCKFYDKIITGDKVKSVLIASTLDNSSCDYCVYKPYCGVCPVLNFTFYGNLMPPMNNTDWCKRQIGIFDYVFTKLQNKKSAEVFKSWLFPNTQREQSASIAKENNILRKKN